MASTYTWHPGSNCVNQRWAIPVPLLPDEILSSWLVRAALAHGCDPMVLTGEVWPKLRIWIRDTDRAVANDRLRPLSSLAGITPQAFQHATLGEIASLIHGELPAEKVIWPWVLALGARNTKRNGGLQYCPTCLAQDAKPYYRLQNRLAWYTACDEHNCLLLDRCWKCAATIEPHRLLATDKHVALCASCKADLRATEPKPCSHEAMVFQRAANKALHGGSTSVFGASVSVADWFGVADFFVSLVRQTHRSATESLLSLAKQLGAPLPKDLSAVPGAGVEMLRVVERQQIFLAAGRFLAADKDSMVAALKESGVTRQGFSGQFGRVPVALAEMVDALPGKRKGRTGPPRRRAKGPRQRHQVKCMAATLERRLKAMLRSAARPPKAESLPPD